MATDRKATRRYTTVLGKMPVSFLDCRDMRHAWKRLDGYHPFGESDQKKYVARKLVCTRCGCERTDVINVQTFDRISTSYHYPTGYQIKNVGGPVDRNALVRREVYARGI